MSDLIKIREEFLLKLKSKLNISEINQIKIDLFGKNGLISLQFKKIGTIPDSDRKKFASDLNIIKNELQDLINNKRNEIERIISFLNLKCSETAINRALKYSSFTYMKQHESKFGDQPIEKKEKVYNKFIRKGKEGEGKKQFSKEQRKIFNDLYIDKVKDLEKKIFINE